MLPLFKKLDRAWSKETSAFQTRKVQIAGRCRVYLNTMAEDCGCEYM